MTGWEDLRKVAVDFFNAYYTKLGFIEGQKESEAARGLASRQEARAQTQLEGEQKFQTRQLDIAETGQEQTAAFREQQIGMATDEAMNTEAFRRDQLAQGDQAYNLQQLKFEEEKRQYDIENSPEMRAIQKRLIEAQIKSLEAQAADRGAGADPLAKLKAETAKQFFTDWKGLQSELNSVKTYKALREMYSSYAIDGSLLPDENKFNYWIKQDPTKLWNFYQHVAKKHLELGVQGVLGVEDLRPYMYGVLDSLPPIPAGETAGRKTDTVFNLSIPEYGAEVGKSFKGLLPAPEQRQGIKSGFQELGSKFKGLFQRK